MATEDSSILEKIGATIKRARHTRGWSQDKLSEVSGVDKSYLGKVERGVRNVSVLTLCEIAKALGVSFLELITAAYEDVHSPQNSKE